MFAAHGTIAPVHPEAAKYAKALRSCRWRARATVAGLALALAHRFVMGGAHVVAIVTLLDVRANGPSDAATERFDLLERFMIAAQAVGLWAFVATGVLYFAWLHGAVKLTRRLGGGALAWTPGWAVCAHFVPIANLYNPYGIVRDLLKELTPTRVDEPPRRIDPDAVAGYRGTPYVAVPPPRPVPRAMVGLWWCSYLGAAVVGLVAAQLENGDADGILWAWGLFTASMLASALAAGLGILLVRSITAHLEERLRRIALSTPEELDAQGIGLE